MLAIISQKIASLYHLQLLFLGSSGLKRQDGFVDGGDFCNIKRRLHACQAIVDARLGSRWETYICENIVWLQLGLEHHRYFNQNRFGDYGDLCLDGGNFSTGFAFKKNH